ncbi:MAG: hypothetical protein K5767_06420 [Clostridia bacterium]|nr:hypothetical protein [Clostridia bacterium]
MQQAKRGNRKTRQNSVPGHNKLEKQEDLQELRSAKNEAGCGVNEKTDQQAGVGQNKRQRRDKNREHVGIKGIQENIAEEENNDIILKS